MSASQAEGLGEYFCEDGLFLRAAVAGSVFPQCCLPKERVSGTLTLSHLGDCKSWIFQERFVWCAEISNYLFNVEKHTLLKHIFSLAVWGSQKIWNLVLSWSLWIKFFFTIQSKNTEQWSLWDVHTSNPEGNIRGSCIWSVWFLWVFLPFYRISLSREYYLYEIILIWFQFIKLKECVRQSVLKRSGIWTVIESIPSQLIYVTWWETSAVQFVQRKWKMFTLLNNTKKKFSEWSSRVKGKVWVLLSDRPYLGHLLMKEDGGNVLQWNRTLLVLCELPGLLVFHGSVLGMLFVKLGWEGLCPHV